MKGFSLLLKPASADCNLRCEYCFYIDHLSKDKTRMSDEVLEKVISSYLKTSQPLYSFGWQGGEPTVMGLDFFRKAVEFQKKHAPRGVQVNNGLQTNATLITREMAEFFTAHHFLLGVSLDGPRDLHNHYRKDAAGKDSHEQVMRGIENLKAAGTEFNILTLVNSRNVHHPKEIYRYLKDKGYLYHQYIPCVEYLEGEPLPWTITGEEWGDFLLGIFRQWIRRDTRRVSIREFDSLINYLVTGRSLICTMDTDCRQYFVVEYNGDIFPCDFFVRPEKKLGNVMQDSFETLWESEEFRCFGEGKKTDNPDCAACPYLELCHGGCQKDRVDLDRSALCRGYRKFYDEALPAFRELAKELTNRNR